MKNRVWMLLLLCLISVSTFVCGCSSNSQPSIVGQWKSRVITSSNPQALEVFEDGTAVMLYDGDFYQCKYVREDNTIVYDNEPMNVAVLTKSTLVLAEQDDDEALVFDRVKD